jgi:hypothetical protein
MLVLSGAPGIVETPIGNVHPTQFVKYIEET